MRLLTLLLISMSSISFSHNLKVLDDFSFEEDEYAVVQFSADWCGPCKSQYPEMEKANKTFPQVNFYVVDVDNSFEVKDKYGVSSIPNTFFFVNGNQVDSNVGAMDQSSIESKVTNMMIHGGGTDKGSAVKSTLLFFLLVIPLTILTLKRI